MVATLDVTIDNGSTTYSLPANSITVQGLRSPISAPPGANVDPILVDIGFTRPQIRIEGVMPVVAGNDGTNTIPTKETLETVLDSWYNQTITLTVPGSSYVGKIQQWSFSMRAAEETRWDFVIVAYTKKRS